MAGYALVVARAAVDAGHGPERQRRSPEWLSPQAEEWLHARREARREVCRRLLEEAGETRPLAVLEDEGEDAVRVPELNVFGGEV